MTTLCTECGEKIDSIWIVESLKTILHLRKNHPHLYNMFRNGGKEQMMGCVRLESGEVVHLIGENVIEYEKDGGKRRIEIS